MYRRLRYCAVDVTTLSFFFASSLVSIPQILSTPVKLERTRELRDEWAAWREGSVFFGSAVAAFA